jgi:hypothetical protein
MEQGKSSKRRTSITPTESETETATDTETTTATATATPTPSGDDGSEWVNRRASAQATRAANARQVSGRRRFVDPTTCEREYSEAELEFMQAMHEYKHRSGRMFPTWSEVLEVLKALGYQKPSGVDGDPDLGTLTPTACPVTAG